jgi:NAD(P) transhydrogenase subunit alpha
MTKNGVAIHAPLNLPASMPTGSSSFYSRNIYNLLLNFIKLGEFRLDFDDEVTAATVITHGGEVVQAATKQLLQPKSRGGARA